MLLFGGTNFRWRGGLIRTLLIDQENVVSLPRAQSYVNLPCNLEKLKKYSIKIIAKRISGNGQIKIKFCSVSAETPTKDIYIKSFIFSEYSVVLENINSCDVFLKIWKTEGGNITISKIIIESIEEFVKTKKTIPVIQELKPVKQERKSILKKSEILKKPKSIKKPSETKPIEKKSALFLSKFPSIYFKNEKIDYPNISTIDYDFSVDLKKSCNILNLLCDLIKTKNGPNEVINENYELIKVQKNQFNKNPEISFITCVNNIEKYTNLVFSSLYYNNTDKNIEIIPILNTGNVYSAPKALNIGIEKAKSNILVLCHQDVAFLPEWINKLFEILQELENWGVLGTAGINPNCFSYGVVFNINGKSQWTQNKSGLYEKVQTIDEHCMIIKKDSGLKLDEQFNGFHFYGADLCLTAQSKNLINYGINNPLIHASSSSSLLSGKLEFYRLLDILHKKWSKTTPIIRTPVAVLSRREKRALIRFKEDKNERKNKK